MKAISCAGIQGEMSCRLFDIPLFPGRETFLGYPEAIGDAARAVWFGGLRPIWEAREDGVWISRGRRQGELSYEITVTPGEDFVECRFRLTNESSRAWKESLAFNCFQCGMVPEIRDHECVRTYVGLRGRARRLVELPRVFGPRPTIQLYSVEGAPPGTEIPFVASFAATPDIVLESWIGVLSRDGRKFVATVSKPALFLFQNMEYGCIHSATGFGPLEPGQSAQGSNRVYFVASAPDAWRARIEKEGYL